MRRTPLKTRKNALGRTKTPKPRRRAVSDLKRLKTQLWELCKQITRLRHGLNCYTCGKYSEHPHTGHFITSSTCSVEMRYDLSNLRPQCYHCNINLSGNWIAYETHLIQDGINPQTLKDRNQATKGLQYDITWYRKKVEEYEFIHSREKEKRDRGGII